MYARFQEILNKARSNKSPNKPDAELNEFENVRLVFAFWFRSRGDDVTRGFLTSCFETFCPRAPFEFLCPGTFFFFADGVAFGLMQILDEHRRNGAEDLALEKRVEGKKAQAKKRATRRSECL